MTTYLVCYSYQINNNIKPCNMYYNIGGNGKLTKNEIEHIIDVIVKDVGTSRIFIQNIIKLDN